MDTWRLSRIEEELDKLDFMQDPDEFPPPPTSNYGSLERPGSQSGSRTHTPYGTLERAKDRVKSLTPSGTLERRGRSITPTGSLERARSLTPSGTLERTYKFSSPVDPRDISEEIYSKIVVKPAYSREDLEQEAVKHFTGKYESLGKVRTGSAASSPMGIKPIPGLTSPQGMRSPGSTTPISPTSPLGRPPPTPPTVPPGALKSPQLDGGVRKEIIRPKNKPPPVPKIKIPQLPTSVPSSPPTQHTDAFMDNRLSLASTNSSQLQHSSSKSSMDSLTNSTSTMDTNIRRSHSQSSAQPGAWHSGSLLTEADVSQVEMFYRSHKSEVFVCQCMANLYEGTVKGWSPSKSAPEGGASKTVEIWNYMKPGIPVVVLDSGESRRGRKLNIMLSERGTGFTMWKDVMNHLTNYSADKATFHTMHISTDHNKMAALSFDDPVAANDFLHTIHILTNNPDDDILNLSGKKRKKDHKKKKQKYKPPNKADISSPCCFTHVTKLDRGDGMSLLSAPTPPPPKRTSSSSHSLTSLPRPRSIPSSSP